MKGLLAAVALLAAAGPAAARPVVVELFTSEACSSCPPAEALLRNLQASDPGILPLSFHVTYWNGPGWTDGFSLAAATDRQNWYAGLANAGEVYTPEAVVDGTRQMVGSDRGDVTAAIAAARAGAAASVPISLGGGAAVTVLLGGGAQAPATAWLIGYDPMHTTRIGGGENGGATLTEVNVVRSVTTLGSWHGVAVTYRAARPAGAHLAVLLQAANGAIEGAATD